MLNLEKKKKIILNFFVFLALLFFLPVMVKAEYSCEKDTTLKVVARDSNGPYISNVQVDVFKQVVDADGRTKPGDWMGGENTDPTLGSAAVRWRNSSEASGTYVLRIRTIEKSNAGFYYYGLTMGCGETATIEKTLSGIFLTLHKGNNNLLTNTEVNIYTQLKDDNGNLLSTKNEYLTTITTNSSGQARAFLPQGTIRSINNTPSDFYVLEVPYNDKRFNVYNVGVSDGQMTDINYTLTVLRLRLIDANDKAAANAKVLVFKQQSNLNSQHERGDQVGEFTMNEQGYSSIELPTGWYMLMVEGADGKYQYFWDINIDGTSTSDQSYRTITLDKTYNTSTSCQKNSSFYLSFKTVAAETIPGLKFELYEQKTDANGFPAAGNKITSGTMDSTGWAVTNFVPNTEKTYMLRAWDERSDLGEFWFYDAVKFVCGAERRVIKTVPALKVILRDSQGNLRKNTDFSLYSQKFDVDGNPTITESNLIGNFQTDFSGQKIIYVSPYNPYRKSESGIYALITRDSGGHTVTFFNINVSMEKDATFSFQTTGLNGVLTDARGRILADKDIILYPANSNSNRRSDSRLVEAKTDSKGLFKFEYRAGTYTLVTLDDFNRENNFGNITMKTGNNYKKLVAGAVNFGLSNSQTANSGSNSLILYSLALNSSGAYYRNAQIGEISVKAGNYTTLSLAAGAYLAVFNGSNEQEFGRAFYVKNGLSQNVVIETNSKFILNANQTFRLSGAPTVSDTAPTGTPAKTPTVSLSSRLKGRILLQVEDKGQAWYVNPTDGKKYYLGRPSDAFNVMRRVGLGISNKDFTSLQKNPSAWKRLAGKILLKAEDGGRAYYFDPISLKLYSLGRPTDAFNVMRARGLGVKTGDLNQVQSGVN